MFAKFFLRSWLIPYCVSLSNTALRSSISVLKLSGPSVENSKVCLKRSKMIDSSSVWSESSAESEGGTKELLSSHEVTLEDGETELSFGILEFTGGEFSWIAPAAVSNKSEGSKVSVKSLKHVPSQNLSEFCFLVWPRKAPKVTWIYCALTVWNWLVHDLSVN